MDRLSVLRCRRPRMLEKWAIRQRFCPAPDFVQKVVSMVEFASPVGLKGSPFNHVERRICFNEDEN
ncbi:hypothetical protein DPMN_027952 [Dreissena polymorpha]|uniref:Uncharacterized protein n=1 Tax=Dreissena polymorpha TaxID=45954 RepID=A0A9D4LW42_DREPO|nr:hypothetical protein DPMN_027952 [Dreissena polymorpha]